MASLDAVTFLTSGAIGAAIEVTVANIDSPTELNARAAAQGDLVIARTVQAGDSAETLYYADTTSSSQDLPWVVSSATAGVKFLAMTGHAINQMLSLKAIGTNTPVSMLGNIDGYSEINSRNLNSGTSASSDLVATADNGTASTHYVDVGINGSTGGAAPFTTANHAYVYTVENVLNVGATGATGAINMAVGATPTNVAVFDITNGVTFNDKTTTTKQMGFDLSAATASTKFTFTLGAQTASRSGTLPVLTGNSIFTLSNATLTTARIPFATTNGILTDSANLTFGSNSKIIGVRRTPHTWGTNYGGVEVQSTSFVEYNDGAANIQCNFFGNIYDDGAGTFKYAETGATSAFRMFPTSRLFTWSTSISGTTGNAVTLVETMRLDHTALTVASTTQVLVSNTTDATTKDTGSIITEGGIGVEKAVYAGTNITADGTTDATSSSTGTVKTAGGLNVAKNIIHRQGRGAGITRTATAAGTTTLTSASTEIQEFTGSTTQTVQFPAANLFGAGISVLYTINNQSSGTVTPTRAGSDTFAGGGTTDPVVAGACTKYASDGISVWLKV